MHSAAAPHCVPGAPSPAPVSLARPLASASLDASAEPGQMKLHSTVW
jgi:hypothetical protein